MIEQKEEFITDEQLPRLMELFQHRGWPTFEHMLNEMLKDLRDNLETVTEQTTLFRHQGSIEAIRNIINIKETIKMEFKEDG